MKRALPYLHLRELAAEFRDIDHFDPAVNRAQNVFDGGDKAPAHHDLAAVVYCHQNDGSEKQACWRVHVTMDEKTAPRAIGGLWGDWVLTGPRNYERLGSELQCSPDWYAEAVI